MGNQLRLNEKIIRSATPKAGRDYQIFDSDIAGFAIRIYRSGSRAFTMDYRINGRQRRYRIGPWPEWTVVAARERAKELRRQIDAEIDPHTARDLQRTAPTVSDMIDRYIEEHLPRLAPRSQADQISMMRKMVEPAWGTRLVTEITKRDVAQLLNEVAKGRARPHKKKPNNRARKLQGPKPTPIRANRLGQALRKMFNLAIEWEWRSDNPAQKFHQRTENSRERFLSFEEIERLAGSAGPRRGSAGRRGHPHVHVNRGARRRGAHGAVRGFQPRVWQLVQAGGDHQAAQNSSHPDFCRCRPVGPATASDRAQGQPMAVSRRHAGPAGAGNPPFLDQDAARGKNRGRPHPRPAPHLCLAPRERRGVAGNDWSPLWGTRR